MEQDREHIEDALHAVALRPIGPHSTTGEVAEWLHTLTGLNGQSEEYAKLFEANNVNGREMFSNAERRRAHLAQLVRDKRDAVLIDAGKNRFV